MDVKKTILIEKLNLELSHQPKQKFKRRFSQQFKQGIRELISSGLTIKEVQELVPVSTFAIRDWTKDIRAELDIKNPEAEFVKVPVAPISNNFLFVFKHSSGFSIEVTDAASLEYLLYKLKSVG